MDTAVNAPAGDPSLVYPSPLKEFWQAFAHNKGAVGGLLFMCLIVFCALFAPWVAPYDPDAQNPLKSLEAPSAEHWFGFDPTPLMGFLLRGTADPMRARSLESNTSMRLFARS